MTVIIIPSLLISNCGHRHKLVSQVINDFFWWNADISDKLLASHFLFHTYCCLCGAQLFISLFIFSDVQMWVNADDDCAVECVIFAQMEDPSLLEESSTLIDPSDPHRGAPLRLGSACFDFFLNYKKVIIYLEALSDRGAAISPSFPQRLRFLSLGGQQKSILWCPSHKYSI